MELPAVLFKYCPPERVDILEGLKVRFSQPAVFNDIFECLPGTDLEIDFEVAFVNFAFGLQQEIDAHPEWGRKIKRAFEREQKSKFEKWMKLEREKSHHHRLCEEVQLRSSAIMGVFCMSGKWDNVLMWSHYTKDHKGFVIEFSTSDPFFNLAVAKVKYSQERPLLGNRRDGWNDASLFETKSKDWEYEDEFRKFEYFGKTRKLPNGNTLVEFPDAKTIELNNWPVKLYDIPATCIRRVILGFRISEDTKKRIVTALRNESLKHVELSQAAPHRSVFRMEQSQIRH